MKKFIVLAACAVFAIGASAQSFFSTEKGEELKIGVHAGLNLAKMQCSDDGDDIKNRAAFHFGVSVDVPLVKSLHVITGVNFSSKGFKEEFSDELYVNGNSYDVDYNIKGKPFYLEIPVLASYRYHFNDAAQLELNFGPYFAFGLGGKVNAELSVLGESEEEDVDYFGSGDDEEYFTDKRFDFGLQLGAGVTLKDHYNIGLAYQWGLINFTGDDDYTVKQRNFMLTVGYKF